jgi:hypothetical protein
MATKRTRMAERRRKRVRVVVAVRSANWEWIRHPSRQSGDELDEAQLVDEL